MTVERALLGTTDATTAANYIEDVFSTYLYTGTGAAQTITNGIDLSTKGGMVWLKDRTAANPAWIMDTLRGTSSTLQPSTTGAAGAISTAITAFNSNGFSIGTNGNSNTNTNNYASWTFRKQAKFFDVVTYTGNGVAGRTISHSLGSAPGCIIVKCIDNISQNWMVYHSGLPSAAYNLRLNLTNAQQFSSAYWYNTAPTSSVFTVGSATDVNELNKTYVAYLFAHDAGGFGAAGTDNVISCGSYTGLGSTTSPSVTLGYEPQYVMVKASSTTGNWVVLDVMRGMSQTNSQELFPNLSSAEAALNPGIIPTATGFTLGTTNADLNAYGVTYIYIAIRRGPMRTPTSGASVFKPITYNGTGAALTINAGFPVDLAINKERSLLGGGSSIFFDRLRGGLQYLQSNTTNAEATMTGGISGFDSMTGVSVGTSASVNYSGQNYIDWAFRRAPGFFDVVCYTGTDAIQIINHNLNAVPQLVFFKKRSAAQGWWVYYGSLTNAMLLNTTDAGFSRALLTGTPTSTELSLSATNGNNDLSAKYVAYLFASCSGVSKVGSYTGTGAAQTIDCGFTGGARFVLIKRTDTTGDWYTYDTARGMVSGTDPYLLMNSTAAEVNANYVFTSSTGFSIQAAAPAGINASGGTFIYLAIA